MSDFIFSKSKTTFSAPALFEEPAQNLTTAISHDPFCHINVMVKASDPRQIKHTSRRPAPWVVRAENQAAHPGVKHRPNTHGAWLECYIHNGSRQPVVAGHGGSAPDCQDFGMRRRIIGYNRLVVSSREDFSINAHDYCPDRYFSQQVSFFGLLDCKAHEEIIAFQDYSQSARSA